MAAINAVAADLDTTAVCQSVGMSRASLYRRRQPPRPSTPSPVRVPSPRALVPAERQVVLDTLHSERFVDQSPAEVHATLLAPIPTSGNTGTDHVAPEESATFGRSSPFGVPWPQGWFSSSLMKAWAWAASGVPGAEEATCLKF